MNAAGENEGSLKNFYGYKETFGEDTTWVKVPKELKFVHTNNPYKDTEDVIDGSRSKDQNDSSAALEASPSREEEKGDDGYQQLLRVAYPEYATQGLEALSAVASQNQYHYTSPPPMMTHDDQRSLHQALQQDLVAPEILHVAGGQHTDYTVNLTSAGVVSLSTSNIDPHLSSQVPVTDSSASDAKGGRLTESGT